MPIGPCAFPQQRELQTAAVRRLRGRHTAETHQHAGEAGLASRQSCSRWSLLLTKLSTGSNGCRHGQHFSCHGIWPATLAGVDTSVLVRRHPLAALAPVRTLAGFLPSRARDPCRASMRSRAVRRPMRAGRCIFQAGRSVQLSMLRIHRQAPLDMPRVWAMGAFAESTSRQVRSSEFLPTLCGHHREFSG